MSFIAPVALLALIVVPVAVAAYVLVDRTRDRRVAAWTSPALLPNMTRSPPSWRRHLPVALLLVGVALLLVGFARPKATVTKSKQDATVIVVLDESGSMAAKDASPTRLGAARRAALAYVAALPHGYRMALVTFSDHASVRVPPTDDLAAMRAAISRTRSGPQGTALAAAVAQAVKVAKSVKAQGGSGTRPPATIVLFSDGGQTQGRVTPQQAAAFAKASHVPVTAVAVGTPDGVVTQPLKGGYQERIQVPVQPSVLKAIAQGSGGRFVTGAANAQPKATFAELGSRVGHRRTSVEVTSAAAGGGLVFLLAGGLLSGVWFRRLV